MREIEFRGKKIDNGEWIESSFIMIDKNHELLSNEVELFYNGKWQAVIPETLGQYTGLKDKNGNKIFEGDIIAHGVCAKSVVEYGWVKFICHRLFKDGREFKSIDEYNEKEFIDLCNVYKCEVIGNIYDNPELLGVEND